MAWCPLNALVVSEILLRAFILRRGQLIARGFGDVVVIGSTHCAGTLRVKEFLTRNGHPYAYIDLDRDAEACMRVLLEDGRRGRRQAGRASHRHAVLCPSTRSGSEIPLADAVVNTPTPSSTPHP